MAYDADEKVIDMECPRCFKKFIISAKEVFDMMCFGGCIPICNSCRAELDNMEPRRGGVPISTYVATYGKLAELSKVRH